MYFSFLFLEAEWLEFGDWSYVGIQTISRNTCIAITVILISNKHVSKEFSFSKYLYLELRTICQYLLKH